MKKSIPNMVCAGALIVSSVVVAHCGGGDDSGNAAGNAGSAGTAATGAGGSSNAGGSASSGTGGASSGGGGTATTSAGGSAGNAGTVSTGTGGSGATGTGGSGATGAGGSSNNAFCPATEPATGDACTPPPADAGAGANACLYTANGNGGATARTCSCRAGGARNDAGMRASAWLCVNAIARPDAGPPPVVDAGLVDMCPANNVPNNANCNMFVTGLMCPGNGGRTCTCRAGMGGVGGLKAWNCPAVPVDAAGGG